MSDFPIGLYRSSTFGSTITNFCNGIGAVRVYGVFLQGSSSSSSALKFYNGLDTTNTSTNYLTVSLSPTNPTWTSFESQTGLLFVNGCSITTTGAIDFGVVTYCTELY
jgi:hypothetical protein